MAEEFEIIRANLLPAAGTITDNDAASISIANETVKLAEALNCCVYGTNVVFIAGYIAFDRKNFTAKVLI